jgi:hypothetical protein
VIYDIYYSATREGVTFSFHPDTRSRFPDGSARVFVAESVPKDGFPPIFTRCPDMRAVICIMTKQTRVTSGLVCFIDPADDRVKTTLNLATG